MAAPTVWIERLKAPDAATRQEAIRQLELIGDPALLGPLATVFATDPDPALRELAQAAGKRIYYAAIKRREDQRGPSAAERQKAANILAAAQARKQRRRS